MAAATQIGVILGTAAYMSPEQARGKPVDRRADVWAFGCVLFELLSGERAFGGDDVSMTLASVLKVDLDWSALPAATPAPARRMIERCLETEPRKRYQSIGDLRYEIEEWLASGFEDEAAWRAVGTASPWQRSATILSAAALAVAAAVVAWVSKPVPDAPLRIVEFDVTDLSEGPAGTQRGRSVVISPDGSSVLLLRDRDLWLRRLDTTEARLLVADVTQFAYSPDGHDIVYDTDSALMRLVVATGSVSRVADTVNYGVYGLHWGESGRLLISKGGEHGLRQVDIETGETSLLLEVGAGDTRFVTPWELTSGEVMFSLLGRGSIEVFDGETRHLVHEVAGSTVGGAIYTTTGHVVWAQWGVNQGIWAAPFSLQSRSFTGEPVRLSEVAGLVSESGNELLIIDPTRALGPSSSAALLVTRNGERVRELLGSRQGLRRPSLSPDGRRLAVNWQAPGTGNTSVFVHDLERGTSIELGGAGPPGNKSFPTWTPDGAGVVYIAVAAGALLLEDASDGDTVTLVAEGVRNQFISVSPDGRQVFYSSTDGDIWYVETSGGEPVRFRETDDLEEMPSLAPSGRHLAYGRSSTSGTSGLFIERFPGGGDLQVVTTEGWDHPRWSRDSRELYYQGGVDGLFVVSFDPDTGELTSRPEELFDGITLLGGFDATSDGLFIVPRAENQAEVGRLSILIENWPQLLERR